MSEAIVYKPIETSFRRDGFDYRQIQRTGDVAIFEQSKPGVKPTWLEVVIIRRHGEREVFGKRVEPMEAYPGSEQWGTYGWTFRGSMRAIAKFEELVAAARIKAPS
jgi:hypothetical protein